MHSIGYKDTVIYQGKNYEVRDNGNGLFIMANYRVVYLKDIPSDEIVLKTKYQAKMTYAGAEATVLSCAMDDNNIIYLELVGHEDMVKSITSVIMQGRIKMNDHYLTYSEGYFNVHRGGTRRMLRQLDSGYAHAICYHSPSIVDTNFSCLLGNTEEDLLNSFETWLVQTNPLPYPPELKSVLFEKLSSAGKIQELNCFGSIKGVKMDKHLGDNEYEAFQQIILEAVNDSGMVKKPMRLSERRKRAPYPKSRLLLPQQVKAIYDEIEKLPKTYELDDVWPKPCSVKLFGGSFTVYVVEQDAGSSDDEFYGMQTQAFGYFYNEAYQEGEWGYLNVDELVSSGLEMDLYFGKQYLDIDGNIVGKVAA